MRNRILTSLAGLFLILCSSASYPGAQQVSRFAGLENYLHKQMVGTEPIQVILDHLNKSERNAPLEDLVAWSKAGFPDLQDKNGYWKTESISLKLGIVHALYYYFSTSPPTDKSTRYLTVIDELQREDYITYHLVGLAHLVVDETSLEAKALQLLEDKDPKLRAQGVRMGETIAKQKRYLFERYDRMVKNDADAHVRTTILRSIINWRTKEVGLIAFDRLVNDPNADVRAMGDRGLEILTDHGVLSDGDLSKILPPLLSTNDAFVRMSVGRAAAKMATPDKSLYVRTDKFTKDLLDGFINQARKQKISDADLAKLWLEWWTPLIPEYTVRPQNVH